MYITQEMNTNCLHLQFSATKRRQELHPDDTTLLRFPSTESHVSAHVSGHVSADTCLLTGHVVPDNSLLCARV